MKNHWYTTDNNWKQFLGNDDINDVTKNLKNVNWKEKSRTADKPRQQPHKNNLPHATSDSHLHEIISTIYSRLKYDVITIALFAN